MHDIYVFDRETRVITLETEALDARTSNGSSGHADLSSDGRYLVFDSIADNLTISADRNGLPDVFVRDCRSKTTRRLSLGPSGQEANGTSEAPVISEDGRFVAFTLSATNLVADVDANGAATDVYLARIETGEITRASVDSTGAQFAVSFAPSLGSDGHLVAYTARGRDEGSAPGRHRASRRALGVYVRDTTSGQTTCVSCGSEGAGSRVPSFAPDLSSDGRLVTFVVQSGRTPCEQTSLFTIGPRQSRRSLRDTSTPAVTPRAFQATAASWCSSRGLRILLCSRRAPSKRRTRMCCRTSTCSTGTRPTSGASAERATPGGHPAGRRTSMREVTPSSSRPGNRLVPRTPPWTSTCTSATPRVSDREPRPRLDSYRPSERSCPSGW